MLLVQRYTLTINDKFFLTKLKESLSLPTLSQSIHVMHDWYFHERNEHSNSSLKWNCQHFSRNPSEKKALTEKN